MFQDLADENNLDDTVLDGDDFPLEEEDIETASTNRAPENLIRDEDGDDFDDDEDSEDTLFDSFEDRDLL